MPKQKTQWIVSTVDATIWFVSPVNGSDANAGDQPDCPFATVEAALAVAETGDKIAVEVTEETCDREYAAMKRMVTRA